MAGIDFVVPYDGEPDDTLPYADPYDALLVPGSLALFEPAHSANPWAAGVPATAYAVPNIAWEHAAVAVGSGDETTLKGTFTDLFTSTTYRAWERTTKGALHGMISQLADATSGERAAYIALPTLIRNYMYTNITHDFYLSLWQKVTRVAKSGASVEYPIFGIVKSTGSNSNYYAYASRVASFPSAGVKRLGAIEDPGPNTAGNTLRAISWNDVTGTFSANTEVKSYMPAWGGPDAFNTYGNQYSQSHAFYRCYLEDLTVSGRTYDEVAALDAELWETAFAEGGRYYGDTLSDPATTCP